MDIVPDTAISDVDGERNRIVVRGRDLAELAGRVSYEEISGLILGAPFKRTPIGLRPSASLMDAVVSAGWESPADMISGMAVAAARLATPGATAELSHPHAEDYLRMVTGSVDSRRAAALETYLVTMAENGLNTSTFAARVVASTGASLTASVVAALAALEGPLHGGAPGPVLDMLEEIGSPESAADWVRGRKRIPGIGHRIFKGRDPRAGILERAALGARHLETARAVERAMAGKGLFANVELYTAVLLDAVGIPKALFTPTFAVSRVVGWCAHVEEQRKTGKLIQPNARYVGPSPH